MTNIHRAWNQTVSSWSHCLTTRQSHRNRGRGAPQSQGEGQADHLSPRGSRREEGVAPRSSYLEKTS